MKTIIVAFWSTDLSSGKESGTFQVSTEMVRLLQEEKVYVACFKEETFLENKKLAQKSRIKFINEFIFEQFLFTKCQTVLLIMNENLKKSFLQKIGYHKASHSKSELAPSIPGDAFKEDDKIFIYLQDREHLGFFPKRGILFGRTTNGQVKLRIFSNSKFN